MNKTTEKMMNFILNFFIYKNVGNKLQVGWLVITWNDGVELSGFTRVFQFYRNLHKQITETDTYSVFYGITSIEFSLFSPDICSHIYSQHRD